MTTAALLVAAGRGQRAGGAVPKQFQPLAGRRVLDITLATFAAHTGIDQIVLVLPEDALDGFRAYTLAKPLILTAGGDSRQASVLAGLKALAATPPDHVLIHDIARATLSAAVIDGILHALETHPGAAPALAVTDALWQGDNGVVASTRDRSALFRAQTPQGFDYAAILSAHLAHPGGAADDVEVALAAGIAVAITRGDEDNFKITTPGDFDRAARIIRGPMDIRTGNGFDVHAFCQGDHVTLNGVRIAHSAGLLGHSDADVAMHALTDAIYGALARGDIGQWFPPSDPQWKGAASSVFLRHAAGLARDEGFTISHCDVTIICELPKIGPHAAKMRDCLSDLMGVSRDRISVKATTSEKLGFTGRGEGIAAIATATLVKS